MDVRAALNDLLTDPELQRLEQRARSVSLFEVLGVEGDEVTHSALLRWLLDPGAGHGMGAEPLRRFLLAAARIAARAPACRGMADAADVGELDLNQVAVECEVEIVVAERRRRLDVLVSLPCDRDGDDGGRPLLVIENKVDASEGDGQTADYAAWAREHPLRAAHDPHVLPGRAPDEVVLPLLVFLCPARDDGTAPAPPFVYLDYDAYCAWIEGLAALEKTPRARFLLEDFRLCLLRRDDVSDAAEEQIVARLAADHAGAIAVLSGAKREQLAPFSGLVTRHRAALTTLGALPARAGPLGASALVKLVRTTLERELPAWEHGAGAGCVTALFPPAQEVLDPHALKLQLWLARPARERARLTMEVSAQGRDRGSDRLRSARHAVAESLRRALPESLQEFHGGGGCVVGFTLRVPGVTRPADDTPERAAQCRTQVDQAVRHLVEAQEYLATWVADGLPTALA